MKLHKLSKDQDDSLKKIATNFPNEQSVIKNSYAKGLTFGIKDVFSLKDFKKNYNYLVYTLSLSTDIIKQVTSSSKKKITKPEFKELTNLINELGISSFGVLKLQSQNIFQDKGIPYDYAIVITVSMSRDIFSNTPNLSSQNEVLRIYGKAGNAVIEISKFLRKSGYNAVPNHPHSGSIDYCKAGALAGLGYFGRHGMLITPENGPCHRLAVVYTDIDNIEDYIENKDNHEWISEFCKMCGKCIKMCPTDAILIEKKVDEYGNTTSINYEKCSKNFKQYGCGICIKECPFTSIGYQNLYANYQKNNQPILHQ